MITRLLLAIALQVLIWPLAHGQSATRPNGCGSGWERFIVPDRIKLIGCDFRASCDQHDLCYGACGTYESGKSPPQCEYLRCKEGGDLYGKEECDSIKFRRLGITAEQRRVKCDADFMINIVANNPGNARCELFSAVYPFAVRVLGSKAFV